VSFAAITLYFASQRELLLLLFISLSTQSGIFWIHSCRVSKIHIYSVSLSGAEDILIRIIKYNFGLFLSILQTNMSITVNIYSCKYTHSH
jgi:hypothetical protein